MKIYHQALAFGLAVSIAPLGAWANTDSAETQKMQKMMDSLKSMQQRIQLMQQQLDAEKARNDKVEANQSKIQQASEKSTEQAAATVKQASATKPKIHVGGAVRFNYTLKQYDKSNRNQQGALNFDTFRLNLDGEIDNVILSVEWRYYDYMQVIHHAWVGYKFKPDWIVRAGVVKAPFGNLPYNSNSYYFSSNYYIGLEDFYQLGVSTTYKTDKWRLDFALLKNPEPNGYGNNSYSENVVGIDNGLGTSAAGYSRSNVKPINTVVGRAEYTWKASDDLTIKPGVSAMYGSLYDGTQRQGNYHAYAAHLNADLNRWNVKLQYTDFKYNLKSSSARRLVYGAYAYNSYGPTKGKSVTGELAYTLPVKWGPITSLKFYNDYSRIYDKNASLAPTWMNVTGMAMAAGPVYAYFDFVQAKNQPFVGGNVAPVVGTSGGLNRLFNVNLGYYF
ncbi:MAG: carbohydrate porin [Halothiobacillus sp.]|jgi:hypothetical protein|nr:carbohydrate porin [Halothiobacillus sp.]